MKKYLLLIIVLLVFTIPNAQNTRNNKEELTCKNVEISNSRSGTIQLSGVPKKNSRNVSKSANSGIGETMGDLSVSPSGAAEYRVPIAVPPGVNGVTPQIALSYNSQGGNGIAGYGWNVEGLSVISRIPSTKLHDNEIDGIDFDDLDRFALDGQRLLLKSGNYGEHRAEYETENFSNLKITSIGVSPNGAEYGPSHFEINYPDGSFAVYGQTVNSRSRTIYAITYWQSSEGVRINYEYNNQSNNNLTIDKITYGGVGSGNSINEITFGYSINRNRYEQAYIDGVDFHTFNILNSISSSSEGSIFRSYSFGIGEGANLKYDRLYSINERSGDGSLQHTPILFNYDDTEPSIEYNDFTANLDVGDIAYNNSEVVPLDFTGNGKMDFIIYPKNDKTKFWIFKDIQDENLNASLEVNSVGEFETILSTTWLTHESKVLSEEGLVVVKHNSNNNVDFTTYSQGVSSPLFNQYTKIWNAPTYDNYYTPDDFVEKLVPRRYLSGDFNGDGLTDVLAIAEQYNRSYCWEWDGDCEDGGDDDGIPIANDEINEGLSNVNESSDAKPTISNGRLKTHKNSRGSCYSCNSYAVNDKSVHFIDLNRNMTSGFSNYSGNISEVIEAGDQLYTGDFNGDGKTDILHATPQKLLVYSLDSGNNLIPLWENVSFNIGVSDGLPLMLGDYNGDGKTDIMYPVENGLFGDFSFYVGLSNGLSFTGSQKLMPFEYKEPEWDENAGGDSGCGIGLLYNYNLIPVDINADGRTDIIDYRTITANCNVEGEQNIEIFNNLGLKTLPFPYDPSSFKFVSVGSTSMAGNLAHFPIPIFLTSDQPNKNLEFAVISNQWVKSFSLTHDHREDMLLRSIDNNGVSYEIDYSNLDQSLVNSDGMQIYHSEYEETYPNIDIYNAPGTKIVSQLRRISSSNPTLKQSYFYQGAVFNVEGLGFLGFKGIATSNWHTDNSDRIFTTIKQSPQYRGAITHEYTQSYDFSFNVPSSNYITKSSYNYGFSIAPNKVFKLWMSSTSSDNNLLNTSTNSTYFYDIYNNPTNINTTYSGTGSSTRYFFYSNSPDSNYHIGRITKESETRTIGGESFYTEKQYTYSGHLMSQKKTKGNGTAFDIEDFEYDTFGNLIKKTVTPNGAPSRIIEFEYDVSGRFLTKTIDVEGLETSYSYNTNTGTLSKEINPFGQEGIYEYDSWNRLIKYTDYLGKETTTSFAESSNSYTVTDIGEDGSSQISIFDPLKRVTTTKEKNVLGQWISTSYLYDDLDRIWKQSEPYTGSSATQWNETEYDFYGRPIKQTLYTGRVIDISYSGLATTVDDGTKVVTTIRDAIGNITSVSDPGGVISYQYFGNGTMKSADYNGVIVSNEQDGWGRKTKTIDPSAGTYEYQYNGYGQITKEITPKGETNYTYSPIGKLLQKDIVGDNTDMSIQYAYSATHKFPTSITLTSADGNNASYAYAYDSYARLIETVETNTHAEFHKDYTYDEYGRVSTEEYYAKLLSNSRTSTKKTKNLYENGILKSVNDFASNNSIWDLTGENARGQVTSAALGNSLNENYTYNTYGYLTENKVSETGSSPEDLMSLTYDFDTERGILNSRTNSLFSWSETFGYDDLDRLISFNDNTGNKSHTYDDRGRITSNSDIGDYTYIGNSYQLATLDLNNQADLYYQQHELQRITYNAFKKPFEIDEVDTEKIGFQYNAFLGRSHMFYGDNEEDILLRNNRKHYSYDGSMEISHDLSTDKTVFTTYIGGDPYSAPAIWRSEQDTNVVEDYFYLHRDYLGSILMITDNNGVVKEKRHFDAWGNIAKLTDGDGNLLNWFAYSDRGYTGHEHLQGVKLVHMNGRLYDPKLKRFLAPDNYVQNPYNTQNYNRYGYVLNNPLMYVDPSGEIIGEIIAAIGYVFFLAAAVQGVINIVNSYSDSGGSSGSGKPKYGLDSSQSNNSTYIAASVPNVSNSAYKYTYDPYAISESSGMNDAALDIVSQVTSQALFGSVPNGNNLNSGSALGTVTDVVTDMLPIIGSGKDIVNGFRDGNWWQFAAGVGGLVLDVATLGAASVVKGVIKTGIKQGIKAGSKAITKKGFKESSEGGLNLFKWGAKQTDKATGWKKGDYFMNLPNKGSARSNWKQNYGRLRQEMSRGNPIFDSYRLPNGKQIPTGGFLNAERYTLESRGWIYDALKGAYFPPH